MALWGYLPLTAILFTIGLDISSVVVNAAAVAQDPRTSRYDSYNLDKGPVFYEAYYPNDAGDAYQGKRHFDRRAVLERSFQVPFERLAYSAETADRPYVTSNKLFVVMDDEEPSEQRRRAAEFRRNYDTADKTARFQDEHPSTAFNGFDEKLESASVEEISKLVRRAISRDLENWNALERYLEHTANQGPPIAQSAAYSGEENRRNEEGNSYSFPANRQSFDSSKQSAFAPSGKLEDARRRPVYPERNDNANKNAQTNIDDMQADAPAIGVVSDSLPLENIFQPRPQVIRYTFFRKPTPPPLDERAGKAIDNSTPRSYGDNLIREEIADSGHGKEAGESVKVTSIEVSEVPRHKTRHHHGEWPKRDYSAHRRSQTAA